MWVLLARAEPPDAHVWPGRRALAAIDAVAWPCMVAALVALIPNTGLVGALATALCVVVASGGLWRALYINHRYRFTTFRWGRRLALLLVMGAALELAVQVA